MTFVSFVALAVITSSCHVSFNEESAAEDPCFRKGVTISASFEQPGSATKTSLSQDCKVLWSKGDEFALLSATGKERFTLVSGEGTGSAEFSGRISGKAPYYALYPYSDNCSISDGKLNFQLPQEQTVSTGSFGNGASPALATMPDASSPAQFRNLCGLLELNLCGSSLTVSRIAVSDLSGARLWGDCTVALDGKEGTDNQTMTVRGGSNEIILNLEKELKLLPSTPRTVYAVVPAGSFSKGFTVKMFDKDGNALSFISTQNPAAKVSRSFISAMNKVKAPSITEPADTSYRGYFKPLFINSGVGLDNQNGTLPAADMLGWEHDYMTTADSTFQYKIFISSDIDANGVLLYPDNEPRYRLIYVHGGHTPTHSTSLNDIGRSRIKTFYNNGGSYVGTCAGGSFPYINKPYTYLEIIPTKISGTNLGKAAVDMVLPGDSPLLDYYDFGGDFRIDSVVHNGGAYVAAKDWISNLEVLTRFDYPGGKFNGEANIAAYKTSSAAKGRIVTCSSHPEGMVNGERRDLMAAMCLYAIDGNGVPSAKATLTNGTAKKMTSLTTPGLAPVGDKQYHHFKITIPAGGAKNVIIELSTETTNNLILSLRKGSFAWMSDADYLLAQAGGNKTLSLDYLEEGTWYVSVYCPDAPKVTCGKEIFTYSGDKSVLNGVPYTIKASWE